jgi:hypothetical protein
MEDRHYCLKLFEDIHQKYNLQECDYKEFVEALGGKKKEVDVSNAQMVKIEFDEIEANVEDGLDEFYPELRFYYKSSKIWNIISDADYGYSGIGGQKILHSSEMSESTLKKIAECLKDDEVYQLYSDKYNRKNCLRPTGIVILSKKTINLTDAAYDTTNN